MSKVIKRADGSTIVVVDGKIVKTMKPKQQRSSTPSNQRGGSATPALKPSPIRISADEISPDNSPSQSERPSSTRRLPNPNMTRPNVEIKRTINVDRPAHQAVSPQRSIRPVDRRQDIPTERASERIYSSRTRERSRERRVNRPRSVDMKRPMRISHERKPEERELSSDRSRTRPVIQRPRSKERVHETSRDKAAFETDETRNQARGQHSRRGRGSIKPHMGKWHNYDNYRPKEALLNNLSDKKDRSASPKRRKRSTSPVPRPSGQTSSLDNINSLHKLLNEQTNDQVSKEGMLDMIQKQAESMLEAQHNGPIDEEKKKKLREAMESILVQRGFIKNSTTKKRGLLRSRSPESSDGGESPPVMSKLHKKYLASENTASSSTNQRRTEAISPAIDNISVASGDQELSDVSQSDMDVSDEEKKDDDEDGKTPAFRRKLNRSPDTQIVRDEHAANLIKIKIGKDAEELAFKELASKLEDIKTSKDVQNLIEAIENKIKSLLTVDLEPSTLEKKIKRYQMLVAKVVMKAESIKEEEEEGKVTYHRYGKAKDRKSADRNKGPASQAITAPVISYPVQCNEQKKPWLYPSSQERNNPHSAQPVQQPGYPQVVQDPVQKVKEQYVSQRPGYHVCLLCMIESNNEAQFQKHLDGKKHQEAIRSKVKQVATPPSDKKFKNSRNLVIRCKLCDITCIGQKKYNDHCNHRSHQALIQAYMKIGRVVPEPEIVHDQQDAIREKIEEIQDSGTPAVGREFMSVKTTKDCDDNVVDVYFCALCKVNCASEVQVERHVRSKKHYLIYVKVTQPEVDIQVNPAEHKKRRETSKKIVSTMKTIKQMEEVIERNRESLNQKYVAPVPTPNLDGHKYPSSPYGNAATSGNLPAPQNVNMSMYQANSILPGLCFKLLNMNAFAIES